MKKSKDFTSFSELYPDVAAQLPPGMTLQVSTSTFAQIAEMKQCTVARAQKLTSARSVARRITKTRIMQANATAETLRNKKKSRDLSIDMVADAAI